MPISYTTTQQTGRSCAMLTELASATVDATMDFFVWCLTSVDAFADPGAYSRSRPYVGLHAPDTDAANIRLPRRAGRRVR